MRHLTAVSCTALLTLGSCGRAPDEAPLGVTTWRVDSVPLLAIGGTAEDTLQLIGNAVGATLLGDSQVVVIDRGHHQLRYFDRSGQLVRTVGREGDGPGEFRYLARFRRCGDSLWVHDISHRKWYVLGLDGTVGRSYLPGVPEGSRYDSPYSSACNARGVFVYGGWDTLMPTGEHFRGRGLVPFWLADASGRVMASLGDMPGSERWVTPGGSGPHPLGKEPVLAIGSRTAYVGSADSFSIATFGLDGVPGPPVVREDVTLATSEADRELWRHVDTVGKSPEQRDSRVALWENFEFPPTVPAYTAMVVDHEDNLWVRSFPRSAERLVRWHVFSPEGAEIGSTDLPGTLEVEEIGADYVLGIETRLSDGAQQVRIYRLHR